jgi:hypothetical protein
MAKREFFTHSPVVPMLIRASAFLSGSAWYTIAAAPREIASLM